MEIKQYSAQGIEQAPKGVHGEVVVHCQIGYRSFTAASLLRQHGVIAAWQAQGLPVQT